MFKILRKFATGTLGERAAMLWTGIAFIVCLGLMVGETGPFLWLANLQADFIFDGTYRPRLTFLILWTLISAPAWVVGKLADSAGSAGLVIGAAVVGIGGAGFLAMACFGALSFIEPGGQLVVVRDVEPGEVLGVEDLEYVSGLEDIPGLAATPVGRVVRTPLLAGDPVFEASLAAEGKAGGVSSLGTAGSRVLWLTLEEGIAGLGLEAQDRIDLYQTAPEGAKSAIRIAKDIQVLAVQPGQGRLGRAAIATDKEGFGAIIAARDGGDLLVMLRSDRDADVALSEATVLAVDGDPEFQAVHAARALPAGVPLVAEDLVLRPGLMDGLATDPEALIGRIPRSAINPGQPLADSLLTDAATGRGVAAMLDAKQRAVAVSLGGADPQPFQPGSVVDVLTVTPTGPEPILSQTEILAFQPRGAGCPCAIVAAKAVDASRILQARSMGTLAFRLP